MAYILTTFPSPTETFIAREINHLAACGWEITIFAARRGAAAIELCRGARVVYRPRRWSLCWLKSLRELANLRTLARLSGVVASVFRESPREAMVLLANLPAVAFFLRQARLRGIRHIHAGFLSWPACVGLAVSRAGGFSLSISSHARDIFVEAGAIGCKTHAADFVVTCTRQGLDRLRATLPPGQQDKVHLVYHGLPLETRNDPRANAATVGRAGNFARMGRLARMGLPAEEAPQVLAVGRLVPKKGFAHLIDAFAQVVVSLPQARLVIVGDGPMRAGLIQQARKLGVADRVTFTGWLENQKVLELMGRSDVLVVPSVVAGDGDRDGIPNVILEAFNAGLPVIASPLPGIEEVIRDRETGILVDPRDMDPLACAIAEVLGNSQLRESLKANAWRLLRAEHDFGQNISQLERLLAAARGGAGGSECLGTVQE